MLQQTNGHNHPVDGVEAQVERVKHKLQKRAREEVTPFPSIYNDALVDIAANSEEGESLAGRLPTFPSLKSSLYRSRRSRLPPLPQSREDVTIVGRWQKTLSGEQFLLRQEDDIHVFATNESLYLLAIASRSYILRWHLRDLSTALLPGNYNQCLRTWPAVSSCVWTATRKRSHATWH